MRSQERAAKAWARGHFARSVVPVKDRNGVTILDHDEHMRPETTMEALAKLKPSFAGMGEMGGFDAVALQKYHWVEKIDHVHTPGNSSGIVDGAALVLVGNEQVGKDIGHDTARPGRRHRGDRRRPDDHADRPDAGHARRRSRPPGLTVDDIDLVRDQRGVRRRRAEVGARTSTWTWRRSTSTAAPSPWATRSARPAAMILGTALDELERRTAATAWSRLCIGGGMGLATIIERV